MVVDKKEHKEILMAMLRGSQVPGENIEIAYELLKSIESAAIAVDSTLTNKEERP